MPIRPPTPPNFPHHLTEEAATLRILLQKYSQDDLVNYYPDSYLLATWHFPTSWQADLDPAVYETQGRLQAKKRVIPSQDLFKQAAEVVEAFINGYVRPESLKLLAAEIGKAERVTAGWRNLPRLPPIMKWINHPSLINGLVKKHVNESGKVKSDQMKEISRALVFDNIGAGLMDQPEEGKPLRPNYRRHPRGPRRGPGEGS